MPYYNLCEAETHFSELVNSALAGEEIIITKDNEPWVKLVPIQKADKKARIGSFKGKIKISEDFDAPLF
jgi:prevent-host-death family protein